MQYRQGTATVTNGSNEVVGTGVNWSQIPAGSLFSIPDTEGVYYVSEVVGPTQVNLTAAYTGPTRSNAVYWLTKDFTPFHAFPIPGKNDLDVTRILEAALLKIDAKLTPAPMGIFSVIDKDLAAPPASPQEGWAYVMPASPTGAWAGFAGKIALYRSGAWTFHAASDGAFVRVNDENKFYFYRSSTNVWELNPLSASADSSTLSGQTLAQVRDWNALLNKPSTFAPSAHVHVIADTTGLQAALDGKQAAGSYSPTSHVHDWSVITGKPSTFAPSAHGHAYSEITSAPLYAIGASAASLRLQDQTSAVRMFLHSDSDGNQGFLTPNGSDWIARFGTGVASFMSANMTAGGNTVWHGGNFNPADKANASHSHDWAQVTGKPVLLSQVASIDNSAIDTFPDYGITTVGYPGFSKTLLAFNPGGSTGQVQQEFFYNNSSAGYWRVRNKQDSTTWQPWKHVMLHDDAQAPISGTVYTSTNLATSVPSLEAKLFNNGGINHGSTPAGFGGRFFYVNGPNSTQAYGMTLGLGAEYASTSYSVSLAIPRKTYASEGYLHYQYTENSGVDAWAKIKAGYADSAGSVVGKPNILSFSHAHLGDWTPATLGATYIGGWHGTSGSGDQYVAFGSTTGALHWTIDGEYYANNGASKVWHAGNLSPVTMDTVQDIVPRKRFTSSTGTVAGNFYANSYLNSALEVYNGNGDRSAFMSFHITGVAGIKFGLNTNAWLATDAAGFQINGNTAWHAGNFDPATKSGVGHGHAMSDITGLGTALSARDTAINLRAPMASPVLSGDVVIANGTNKVIFHQPSNDAFYLAPSNNAGTDWLWSQQLMYDRPNARWAFAGPLLVQGHAVWTAGNFTPASKLDTSEVSTSGSANTVVRRTGNGYVVAPWFDASGGLYSSSSGVHFDVGGQTWGASLFANHTSVQLALRTAGAVTRGHVYADNGNTIGFLNNDANWALQLQKTGPSFLRVNNVLRSIWTSDDMAVHSSRDFVNGTLVTTDLSYPAGSGEAFILEIRGNSYGGSLPFDTVIQGYIYNNTIISVSGISNATHITGMVAIGVGGKLCFWWPRLAYWQGFNVKVYYAQAGEAARNRVTSITDVVKPSGTAEVNITANVAASWTSANFDPGTKFNTSGGTLAGSISTTNGADRSLTLASSTSYNYQLITAGDHFHIREASDAAKVRLSITYPNGNVGIGLTGATSRLQVNYANPASVPAAGATGHAFAAGTTGYGLAAGVLTDGTSYLQSTRWDGGATNYNLWLQPNGADVRIGGLQSGNAGFEVVNTGVTVIQSFNRTAGAYTPMYIDASSIIMRPNGTPKMTVDASGVSMTGLVYSDNWWRSTGQTGWFNASYSTGIWSSQAGEVRTYNGSRFHSEGKISAAGVIVASVEGFQSATYQSGRNRIWSFENADAFGISYYQGAGGWSSMDTINFHFGNTAEGSTLHKFRSDGVAAHAGDLYVKGSRLPVFTSSTGAPSGGTDGDIHITY